MKPASPKPDAQKSPSKPASGQKTYDLRLDPLPLPDEVIESDSDTAWDLWHDTVMPKDTEADKLFKESNFKDTEPAALPQVRPTPKKP